MKWNNTKIDIYRFLCGTHPHGGGYQFTITKIARFLEVSPSYVYRIVRQLLAEEYITKDITGTNNIVYSPTKKSPPAVFTKNEEKPTGVNRSNELKTTGVSLGSQNNTIKCIDELSNFSVSKSQWAVPVSFLPLYDKRFCDFWKETRMANGVKKYSKDYFFGDPVNAPLSFSIIGKRNFKLIVTMPRWNFETKKDFLSARDIIGDFARMAIRFISKKYHFRIDIYGCEMITGDFEHPLRPGDMKKFIDSAQVIIKYHKNKKYIGNLQFDGSGKVDRIESDCKPEWIHNYAEIPLFNERVRALEEQFSKIEKNIDKLSISSDRIEKMLSQPSKEFSKKDLDSYI
jgi:hypothetical protein